MKDLFLSYELALIAKQKGFNEDCLAFYAFTSKNFFPVINPELGLNG